MSSAWVRDGRWDLCLSDVGAVQRLPDGGASVYLRGVLEVRLDAAEARVFLPRFESHARLEDLSAPPVVEAGAQLADVGPGVEYGEGSGALLPRADP